MNKFGPVPKPAPTPVYATPWEVGGSSVSGEYEILTAIGGKVGTMLDKELAEEVVKAINAMHAAPEPVRFRREPRIKYFRENHRVSEPTYYRVDGDQVTHVLYWESQGWKPLRMDWGVIGEDRDQVELSDLPLASQLVHMLHPSRVR